MLPVPYHAFRHWLVVRGRPLIEGDPDSLTYMFSHCWGLQVSLAQSRMRYVYTAEEVFAKLRKRRSANPDDEARES